MRLANKGVSSSLRSEGRSQPVREGLHVVIHGCREPGTRPARLSASTMTQCGCNLLNCEIKARAGNAATDADAGNCTGLHAGSVRAPSASTGVPRIREHTKGPFMSRFPGLPINFDEQQQPRAQAPQVPYVQQGPARPITVQARAQQTNVTNAAIKGQRYRSLGEWRPQAPAAAPAAPAMNPATPQFSSGPSFSPVMDYESYRANKPAPTPGSMYYMGPDGQETQRAGSTGDMGVYARQVNALRQAKIKEAEDDERFINDSRYGAGYSQNLSLSNDANRRMNEESAAGVNQTAARAKLMELYGQQVMPYIGKNLEADAAKTRFDTEQLGPAQVRHQNSLTGQVDENTAAARAKRWIDTFAAPWMKKNEYDAGRALINKTNKEAEAIPGLAELDRQRKTFMDQQKLNEDRDALLRMKMAPPITSPMDAVDAQAKEYDLANKMGGDAYNAQSWNDRWNPWSDGKTKAELTQQSLAKLQAGRTGQDSGQQVTATDPKTGKRIRFINGKWEAM